VDPVLAGVVLGLVQGVAEWIPISSKTQLIVISTSLFMLEFKYSYVLSLTLQSSSVFAAILYFRRDLWTALRLSRAENGVRLALFLVVATCSTGAIGIPLYMLVRSINVGAASGALMSSIGLALLAEALIIYRARRAYNVKTFEELKVRDWVIVGAVQGIAALPGVSRSGVTISAMLFMGVRPDEALRLSYLLYVPTVIGASIAPAVLTPGELSIAISAISPMSVLTAFITGIVVSLITIHWLLEFARRSRVYVVTAIFGVIALAYGLLLAVV